MDPSLSLDDLTHHTQGLARLAGAILGDPHGGEDVAQETLIRALGADRRPARSEELRPWLRTIAKRLALNERAARRSRTDRETARESREAAPSTDEIAARAETAERLHAVVRGLSGPNSAVLLDRYVGGLTPAEIARRDGLPQNTVKARLRRAKVELRAALDAGALGTDETWSIALAPLAALAVNARPAVAGAPAHAAALLFGASLMTKILVPAVCALALVLGLAFLRSDPAPDAQRDGLGARTQATAAAPAEDLQAATPNRSLRSAPARPAAESDPAPAREVARIRGRVTDADGAPLEGVLVAAESAEWTDGRRTHAALETTRSDEEGAWSLELALDGARPDRLRFEPGLFHQNATVNLALDARDDALALSAGDNDAGVLALAAAGACAGRMIDADGAPIAGAAIELAPSFSSHYALVSETRTTSDREGRFELGHLPVGESSIVFRAPGHVSLIRSAVFAAGKRATLGAIQLASAGRAAGRVIDAQGAPIPDQKVVLDPAPSARKQERTVVSTDANGRFEALLRADGPHVVRIEREGFVPVGAWPAASPVLSSGQLDAEFVLEPAARTVFAVVDSTTREPLTRYWLHVTRSGGTGADPRVFGGMPRGRAEAYADGRVERDARERVDLVRAWAPGYIEQAGDVVHDTPGGGVQTIALVRGATIRGRVFTGGRPAREVRVRITDRPNRISGRTLETVTDAGGRYRVDGVAAGTQHVIADVRGDTLRAQTVVNVPLPTAEPAILDADDLRLERPALGRIEGSVLLPPAVAADGLTVYHGDWGDAQPVPLRSDGTFTLEDVPEGTRTLHVWGGEGLLAETPPTSVEVTAGGTVFATIDAAGAGTATLALTLNAPGVDPEDVHFFVRHGRTVEGGTPPARGIRIAERFDADGRAEVSVRADGIVFVDLWPSGQPSLVLYDQPIALEPGRRVERTLRYTPAELEIQIPEVWLRDDIELLSLSLWTEGQHEAVWRTQLSKEGPFNGRITEIDGQRATLKNVPVGRLRMELAGAGPDGWIRAPEDTTVEIRSGSANAFTLPPPRE